MTRSLPPPPVKRRRLPAPPVKTKKIPPMTAPPCQRTAPLAANAHVQRVTLNLIRHAHCCPSDLKSAITTLARCGWDMQTMEKEHRDLLALIYALVDADLADKAKAEFQADTRSIVDHWRDDCDCELCGHRHIRWEFTLRNTRGGSEVKTGSTCIIEYGLNVDGEATAELALAKLRKAINAGKKRATQSQWQEANPDHVAMMAKIREGLYHDQLPVRPGWPILRHCQSSWVRRVLRLQKAIGPITKYYEANEYLTPKKHEAYDEAIVVLTAMQAELAEAREKDTTPVPSSAPNAPKVPTADTDESDLPF